MIAAPLLALTVADVLSKIIIVFVVFTVVSGLAFSLYTILFPEQTAADRLETLTSASERVETTDIAYDNRKLSRWEAIAERLGEISQGNTEASPSTVDANEELRKVLRYAGYKHRRALDQFNGYRLIATFGAPVLLSPLYFVLNVTATSLAMFLAMVAGYLLPKLIVENQATTRQGSLLSAFPDALDLLVSCVESGLNLDTSFRRVANEMRTVAPALAKEFVLVNSEITAGIERVVALKHFEERTGLEEVRSLVNMLAQSERYGSSIADSLRIYSSVAREKRMSRAEELAGQVGSKLTIIMIVFFLPVLMIILLTPSMIRIFMGEG